MRVSNRPLLVCVLTLLAAPAAAQSTTEDGIRAFVGGDYQAAGRILKPLADDPAGTDPATQFFLAVLYHTGLGVGRDESRACSLFLRAAAREHAFTEQSATIAAFMRELLGDGAPLLCVAEERWQGGPPASFVLGPDHRIVFADTSITVTHGGKEQRSIFLVSRGAAFLPIQHTPLTVTRPARARRDVLHRFTWTPDAIANPRSWTLGWWLIEVVGEHWISYAGAPNLAVVDGPTPPATFDATNLVRLHTSPNGEAAFTVSGGGSPRTEVVPSAQVR